jgi:hypothetical protein
MNMESKLGKIVEAFDQKVGPDQAGGGLKLMVFERDRLHRPSGDALTDDAPDKNLRVSPK